jgi:hypothetical protein
MRPRRRRKTRRCTAIAQHDCAPMVACRFVYNIAYYAFAALPEIPKLAYHSTRPTHAPSLKLSSQGLKKEDPVTAFS